MRHQLVASGSGIRRFGVSWPMKRSPRPSLAWIQMPDFTPTFLSIFVLSWNARSSCSKSTKAKSESSRFQEVSRQSEPWPSTEAQLQGLMERRLSSCLLKGRSSCCMFIFFEQMSFRVVNLINKQYQRNLTHRF